MREIIADPNAGLDATIALVPAVGTDRATQLKVLEATTAMWQSDLTQAKGLGAVDAAGWTRSIAFMSSIGLVATPVTAEQLVTPTLLPSS